jgi:exosortase A
MRALPENSRHALAATVALVAALLWMYRDTAAAMVTIWSSSDTFAHAYLVPPIVLWLIWRRRAEVAAVPLRPAPWVLLPMAALSLAWLLGELVAVNALTQFAMTALVVLTIPAVLGIGVARELMFPLAFLFFAVPMGEFMLPFLMQWTADFVVLAVRLSGIPIHQEGMLLVIPSGRWSVVEECSGVRYLIASLMVGTLFAYLNYRSNRRRWIFVGVSILVPIVANWLRAYMIVMIGHLSDNRLAVGVDHLIYGWVFFGIVIAIMFAIGARWAEPPEAAPAAAAGSAPVPAGAPATGRAWVVAGVAAALLMLPHLALTAIERAESRATPSLVLPASASSWAASGDSVPWTPSFANPAVERDALYRDGAREVGAYVAYYRNQDYGSKLVTSQNQLVRTNNHLWNHIAGGTREVEQDGRAMKFRWSLYRGQGGGEAGRMLLVWQTYWIDGRWIAGDIMAKLVGALHRLAEDSLVRT